MNKSDPDFDFDFNVGLDKDEIHSSSEDSELEVQILGNIFQHLHEEGLISNLQYRQGVCSDLILQRRSAIYQLMLTKDHETAFRIFKILRQFFDADSITSDVDSEKTTKDTMPIDFKSINPLMNETVLKVIYRFLDIKDLKSCRSVCHKWIATAEPTFRKQTKIAFHDIPGRLSPSTFADTFKYTLPAVPFTAFSFKGTWSIKELTSFFASMGKNITHLEFIKVKLKECRKNSKYLSFDISPWITESKLENLAVAFCSNLINISLHEICSVQDLFVIDTAIINIPDKTAQIEDKVCPKYIFLKEVKIRRGEEELGLGDICINTIIDFSKAKGIYLSRGSYYSNFTILTVDLSISQVDASIIGFDGIDVLNWRLSQWNVEKLWLNKIPMLEKSGMTFDVLSFNDASIDLCALPETIKKLKISNILGTNTITCTQSIHLPNLRLLEISRYDKGFLFLTRLASCEILHELFLTGSEFPDSEDDLKIDVSWIPQSVKKIKIGSGIQFMGDANASCELKILILTDKCGKCVLQWINKFKYEVLVASSVNGIFRGDKDPVGNVMTLINQRRREATMYIGVFCFGEPVAKEGSDKKIFEYQRYTEMLQIKPQGYKFVGEDCSSISIEVFKAQVDLLDKTKF